MAVTKLQSNKNDGGNSVSLPGATTPGSLLLALWSRNDNSADQQVTTPGWDQLGSATMRAHTTFGGTGHIYWKACTAADQQTVTWTLNSGQSGKLYIVELGGVFAAGGEIAAALAFTQHQNSQAFSLTSGVPGVPALVVAGMVTRLNDAFPNSYIDVGSGVSHVAPPYAHAASNGIGDILWRESPTGAAVSINGTMQGNTQDGYWYGMQIGAFALPGLGGSKIAGMIG